MSNNERNPSDPNTSFEASRVQNNDDANKTPLTDFDSSEATTKDENNDPTDQLSDPNGTHTIPSVNENVTTSSLINPPSAGNEVSPTVENNSIHLSLDSKGEVVGHETEEALDTSLGMSSIQEQETSTSNSSSCEVKQSQSSTHNNENELVELDQIDVEMSGDISFKQKTDVQNNIKKNIPIGDGSATTKAIPDGNDPNHDEPPHDDPGLKSVSHPACQFRADKPWLDRQYHVNGINSIKMPDEIEMDEPPGSIAEELLNRIEGSMIGMALGDALGAHVEFRPYEYLIANPVSDLGSGGTWGLRKGQFTDDTSMALCLANSLVARRNFAPYDQLVRYKWWYRSGYMSSTGQCFDIGAATSQSLREFEHRQKDFAKKYDIPFKEMDSLSDPQLLKDFDVYCSEEEVAGNGALMRLTPVPLFLHRHPAAAVELSGRSGQITHGDQKAYDACRYYGALIVGALHNYTKEELLDNNFYSKHKNWFGDVPLHDDIQSIANGSYKKEGGHKEGIRGKGYIVNALEAALWAFWSDNNNFETGALAAVNLGDDTDTTAAIYGQLAGAYYGYKALPDHWLKHVYAKTFMLKLSKWIAYEGECWSQRNPATTSQE